jgi:hypothetical protein
MSDFPVTPFPISSILAFSTRQIHLISITVTPEIQSEAESYVVCGKRNESRAPEPAPKISSREQN